MSTKSSPDEADVKSLEQETEKHKQLLDKTFASLLDAIFIIDATTVKIQNCNPAASRIFGYTREEMIGRTTDFLHVDGDALEEFRSLLFPSIQEKGSLHITEFRMKRKNGAIFPTENSVMPLEDDQNQLTGWVSVVRDISNHVNTAKKLQESEEKYRTLYESSPIGIGVADMEGNIIAYNEAMLKPGGYTHEDIKQISNMRELYYNPDDRSKVLSFFFKSGFINELEVQFKRKDGTPYDALLSLKSVEMEGKPCLYAIVQDITEQKKAREQLGESEKRFSNIIQGAGAGYFYIDKEGYFKDVNKAWLNMHKYLSEQEIIGQHFSLTQIDMDLEAAKKNVSKLLNGNAIPNGEFTRLNKDGSIGYHTFSATPVIANDKVIGLEGFIIDQTKQKQVEKELLESEELLSNIFESMNDGILVLDTNFHYTFWNRTMEKISKTPREKVCNNTKVAWELFPHLIEQGVDKMMKRAMVGEVVRRDNIPFLLEDGTKGYTSEIFLPLKTVEGEIGGFHTKPQNFRRPHLNLCQLGV